MQWYMIWCHMELLWVDITYNKNLETQLHLVTAGRRKINVKILDTEAVVLMTSIWTIHHSTTRLMKSTLPLIPAFHKTNGIIAPAEHAVSLYPASSAMSINWSNTAFYVWQRALPAGSTRPFCFIAMWGFWKRMKVAVCWLREVFSGTHQLDSADEGLRDTDQQSRRKVQFPPQTGSLLLNCKTNLQTTKSLNSCSTLAREKVDTKFSRTVASKSLPNLILDSRCNVKCDARRMIYYNPYIDGCWHIHFEEHRLAEQSMRNCQPPNETTGSDRVVCF